MSWTKWYRDLSLGGKIGLGMAVLALLFCAVIWRSQTALGDTVESLEGVIDQEVTERKLAQSIEIAMLQARRREKDFLLRRELEYRDQVEEWIDEMIGHAEELRQLTGESREGGEAQAIIAAGNRYRQYFQRVADIVERRGLDEESGLEGQFRDAAHALEAQLGGRQDIRVLYLTLRRHEKDYLMRRDRKYVDRATDTLDELTTAVRTDAGLGESALRSVDEYRTAFLALVQGLEQLDGAIAEMRDAVHEIEPIVAGVRSRARQAAEDATLETQRMATASTRLSLLLTALAIIAAAIFAVLFARSVAHPLVALTGSARRIADGDLQTAVTRSGRGDELGLLEDAFAEMVSRLREMIGGLKTAVSDLNTSSTEVLATATEAATTAGEQATTVTQVAATTEELHQTSHTALGSAREVDQSAQKARETGEVGHSAIASTAEAMGAIGERIEGIAAQILALSDQNAQIGEIVETVNKLAEQSNLLAVNASIEAAKAGDQGSGFAVVASEVRNLAEQSGEATSQIRRILSDIQKATQKAVMATEEGHKRAAEGRTASETARQVLDELVGVLDENATKAQTIVSSVEQQAEGIAEISQAMEHIEQAGRDTATGASQLESAATGIQNLAHHLDAMTKAYSL